MVDEPVAAGKSSFDLIDFAEVYPLLGIKPGAKVLDLACGAGRYTLEIARRMEGQGRICALDLWATGIDMLRDASRESGMDLIEAELADITRPLAFPTGEFDAVLLATILHDLTPEQQVTVLREAARVLAPGGRISIIEFKKIEEGPGPPVGIRLGVDQVTALATVVGMRQVHLTDAGPYNYISVFAT